MNIILIASLLSAATFVLHVAASKESLEAGVSVRPPGPNIYLSECVLLQCTVESHCTSVKSYRWYRAKPLAIPNRRHLVSGDSYYISAVTREDADSYWCQAKCQENKTVLFVDVRPVTLSVSERPPSSLSLTPNTRQMLRGEQFTIQCPASETYSSIWKLLHFSPDRSAGTTVVAVQHSLPGGGVPADKSVFVFIAATWNSGLYWCEGPEGRSNAVNITVSYGNITLKTPASPVAVGDDVGLYCQYQAGNSTETRFFKNGAEIHTHISASSDRVVVMAIQNVTQDDEGFYKCASHDRKMQSPESWLSVRPDRGQAFEGNLTSSEETPDSTSDTWKWITLSFGILFLFLVPLTVWLVYHYRYQMFCTRICWSLYKQEVRAEKLPATIQDATEVQWDLSWMEMTNLLDKNRGT
ncbi:Fc receptor-like protein 5 isoform X2 [Solea solea]|uniref:Fc receptor-like protein 5 isoform X2 n=1 Tax=Solea solea TaxID=90069 RepID=UPI00272A4860|nr:Fc receptor-like protein 5 isoform X2 [Solea solea]